MIGSLKDAEHGISKDAVILVGERLALTHGALSAAARAGGRAPAPASPGCRAVPVTAVRSRPARCPTCCPAAVRVTEAAARVDLAAAWGVDSLPAKVGRDGNAIVAALASRATSAASSSVASTPTTPPTRPPSARPSTPPASWSASSCARPT